VHRGPRGNPARLRRVAHSDPPSALAVYREETHAVNATLYAAAFIALLLARLAERR